MGVSGEFGQAHKHGPPSLDTVFCCMPKVNQAYVVIELLVAEWPCEDHCRVLMCNWSGLVLLAKEWWVLSPLF